MVGDGEVVFCTIFVTHVSPVGMHVAADQGRRAEAGFLQQLQSSGRGDDLAERKLGTVGVNDGGGVRRR